VLIDLKQYTTVFWGGANEILDKVSACFFENTYSKKAWLSYISLFHDPDPEANRKCQTDKKADFVKVIKLIFCN
jgi:hypothetical protein